MVHLSGLDISEVAGLRVRVPRDVEASPLFQGAWDEIEKARNIKGWDQEAAAEAGGFGRSSWFAYKSKATIPFHLFVRLLTRLGLKYRLEVLPARGYVKRTVVNPGAEMPQDTEEARQAAEAINAITDPGFRAKLALRVVSDALKYKHRGTTEGPPVPAEQQTE